MDKQLNQFAKTYAGSYNYPYYNYKNGHLPPNANLFYSSGDTSWTGHAPQYDSRNFSQSIYGKAKDGYNLTGYWNGYFDYLKLEQQAPYPLDVRRGGLSEQAAFNLQTDVYNLPDLAIGTKSRNQFFDMIGQQALSAYDKEKCQL